MAIDNGMIRGSRAVGSIQAQDKVIDMGDLHLLESNEQELMRFVSTIKKSRVYNDEFKWIVDEIRPKSDLCNGGVIAGGGTSIPVDNANYFAVDDLVLIPSTGELVWVTGVPASGANGAGSITVQRNLVAGTTDVIADNAVLLIIGPASAEGSRLSMSNAATPATTDKKYLTTQKVYKTNNVHEIRTPFKLTVREMEMAAAGGVYGGEEKARQRAKKALEHGRSINHVAYFSRKSATTAADGSRITTTDGINEHVDATNKVSLSSLTESEFANNLLRKVFRFGGNKKTMFCSRFIAGQITSFLSGNLQATATVRDTRQTGATHKGAFGGSITTYVSAHGTVDIVTDHALEGFYDGYGFIVNAEGLEMVVLGDLDTKLHTNLQANDETAYVEEYRTTCGFRWADARTHGRLVVTV